jgi:hypothetical protein
VSDWRVTVRTGPTVEKERHGALEAALDAVEMHARATANTERRAAVDIKTRRYEAGDQVAARVELSGPRVHAGVDVRGDGAVQAWTGRWRRQPLALEDGETVYDALRRTLQSTSVEP